MGETGRVVGTDTTAVAVNVDPAGYERQVISVGDPVTANTATVGASGALKVEGASVTGLSFAYAAGATGASTALAVGEAGNITFVVKNTTAGSPFADAPVISFQQSDDGVSWAPLTVTSSAGVTASTQTVPVGAANVESMYDAGLEGVNYVRVNVTTGPTTNGMTVVFIPGTLLTEPSVGVTGTVVTSVSNSVTVSGTVTVANLKNAALTKGTGNGNFYNARVTTTAVATAAQLQAATAGQAIYLTDLTVANSGSAAVLVTISDGTVSGTAVNTYADFAVPAGSTVSKSWTGSPIKTVAGSMLQYSVSAASTTVYVNATGYYQT